jgi:hypothetical protein
MKKINKYNYLLVIQGNFNGSWDDESEYEDTPEGYKQAHADLREYRFSTQNFYQYRLIRRRELNQDCINASIEAILGHKTENQLFSEELNKIRTSVL